MFYKPGNGKLYVFNTDNNFKLNSKYRKLSNNELLELFNFLQKYFKNITPPEFYSTGLNNGNGFNKITNKNDFPEHTNNEYNSYEYTISPELKEMYINQVKKEFPDYKERTYINGEEPPFYYTKGEYIDYLSILTNTNEIGTFDITLETFGYEPGCLLTTSNWRNNRIIPNDNKKGRVFTNVFVRDI